MGKKIFNIFFFFRKLESSAKIGSFMRGLLARYERLRGAEPGEEGEKFWDLVVISAGDTSQQAWYEAQLELKHQSGDLPLVPYHIIPDPPGPRIGSGPDWFTLRPRFSCC